MGGGDRAGVGRVEQTPAIAAVARRALIAARCCSPPCWPCRSSAIGSRYLVPLGRPLDDLRELATAFTLVCGVALVMVRLCVEQRAVEQANERVRLLATACEQAGELI